MVTDAELAGPAAGVRLDRSSGLPKDEAMRSDPQLLLAGAVRRIARARDRAEVVQELCAAGVEHVADAVLVYVDHGQGPRHRPEKVPDRLLLTASDFRGSQAEHARIALSALPNRLRNRPSTLSPDEHRVAEVLADPVRYADLEITGIAELAGTDPGAVVRTATLLGYSGIDELRLELHATARRAAEQPPVRGAGLGGAMGGTAPALTAVSQSGVLAEVLLAGETLGRSSPALQGALRELLGPAPRLPKGDRVLLAPMTTPEGVIGAAVFLRRPDRDVFDTADVEAVGHLATHVALGVAEAPAAPAAAAAPPAAAAPARRERPSAASPPAIGSGAPGRHTGQNLPPGRPTPMPRDMDRLRFAGAATRRIARGIDLDEIVTGLCRATVPTFSDTILVYLREPLPVGDERPTGPLVLRLRRTDRMEQDGHDEDGDRAPYGLDEFLPQRSEVRPGGALENVLRGVRPVLADSPAVRAALPELLGEDGQSIVPDGGRAILAPFRGRRRVIGAALFLRHPERTPFEPDDLLIAAQLATHTALGIDKAMLYGREAYIADELQRTMLPETLPRPTGVRLASRYLPAAETARVGGDWYDAIPLTGSRVALVVGDVMGHSMTSAAIMGQLRTTALTLAGLDLPPQEVLHHLDEQAQRLGTDRMATCVYAVYDPVAHKITIASAGHLPPILLHVGGRAEVLDVPPGAPIGVGGVDFEAVELEAPAGATLLLYTDGLVESRLRDVWTGMEQLREKLAATAQLTGPDRPPPLEALCDEVLDMLGPGDRDDDIALLAARFDGIAPSDVAYWFLEPEDAAPGRARRLVRRALSDWGLEELSDSAELLVSEMVTNAVRYSTRPVTLRLLRTDVLRCEVGDDVPQLPRLRQARATDEGGRGLYLVNRLARRWGATRLSTGKVVWFELERP
ncbi:SpoIIE family protein phosphatase [Streptomyces sp. S.PB5]|uniref:SpoIIE family protein phosphatase n=1 Tax=Streptomyces sp. S.PB5 TaxID=3020844 RepID=UPI0025B264B3|nr:SpoIIE family protein phosphatase [Streptomyces sp. S.PB5]MDN3021625.1 SpoIIE family protein phosphatase [Streptomyces sp. S.PB5]